ncbi:hypothetical protein ACES2J_15890 [Bdellovibrio bacteriovorus]|uniref:hypothetical protein n=1 Tax=Bdellovibrio bacteriovorus TaxID=959 RepID=UPI0035A6D9B5
MENSKLLEAFSIGVTLLLILAGTAQATEHRLKLPMEGLDENRLSSEIIYTDNEDTTGDVREMKVSWSEKIPATSATVQVSSLMQVQAVGAAAQISWSF